MYAPEHDAVIRAHRPLIRSWARQVVRKYPLSFDEAYTALLEGFGEALTRWTPEGGASVKTFCRRRAFGAVQDYCRSLQWTPDGCPVTVKVVGKIVSRKAIEGPDAHICDGELLAACRLACLKPLERDVIDLHYVEGLSLAEIGRRRGVSLSYVCHVRKLLVERLRTVAAVRDAA